ncbi:MAG: hypothetical protein ACE5L7_04225 [Candidatus Aminicenantales bacterium]
MKDHCLKILLSCVQGKGILVFLLMMLTLTVGLNARLRFIGPNPYYSFLTFPQDARLFRTHASVLFLRYRNRGWMGHLDSPATSPAPQYVATEESIQENFYDTKIANVGFKGKWVTPEIMAVPFVLDYKSLRIIPMVSGQMEFFNLSASGEAIAHGEETDSLIPFSSELSQKNKQLSFGLLASLSIKNTPIGMIFNYKHLAENSPSGYLKYNIDGQERRISRFNWGWSTSFHCNKIFGTTTNIDAFWQDRYTHSQSSQWDLVLGTDIKGNKHGLRIRRTTEFGESYSYSDSLDKYIKDDWRAKTSKTMVRSYDVVKLLNIGAAKLYLCGVLEADFTRKRNIKEEVELLDSYRENAYVLELLPFLHFDLDGGGFLRIGSSASFFWKDYKYQDVWGDQKVYSPSWAHFGWERSWERSSYGNEFSFINFSEVDFEIPAYRKWNLVLSVDLWSHQVYRRTRRYYGSNISQEGIYSFHKSAERKSVLKESWFGGTFGLLFGRRLLLGLFLDLPVYYDKLFSTEISGEQGDYFKGLTDAQPMIRTPVGFWAMIIWRW